jgi:hypothetical protein
LRSWGRECDYDDDDGGCAEVVGCLLFVVVATGVRKKIVRVWYYMRRPRSRRRGKKVHISQDIVWDVLLRTYFERQFHDILQLFSRS